MRFFYRCLLQLHPPYFRRQFADEMLWIFDQTPGPLGPAALFFDGMASLARQWILRSGSWKVVVALILAPFEMFLGGLGGQFFRPRHFESLISPREPSFAELTHGNLAHQPITTGILMTLAMIVLLGLFLMIIGLNAWVKRTRRPAGLRVR